MGRSMQESDWSKVSPVQGAGKMSFATGRVRAANGIPVTTFEGGWIVRRESEHDTD